MQRHIQTFTIFSWLLVLAGCPALLKKIIPAPTYDDQCVPSDDYYLALANETKDMAELGEIPEDPKEALAAAERAIEQYGYKLVIKSETGKEQVDMFTTTLDGVIFLEHDWESKTDRSQATVLWHELVHVRQWERLGPEKMTLTYAVTEGRWAIETQAYRETARILVLFGATDDEMEAWTKRRQDSFYQGYALFGMPRECFDALSEDVWAQEWRAAG